MLVKVVLTIYRWYGQMLGRQVLVTLKKKMQIRNKAIDNLSTKAKRVFQQAQMNFHLGDSTKGEAATGD